MKIPILFIPFLAIARATTDTGSSCDIDSTQTSIRQVLKTAMEDLIKQVKVIDKKDNSNRTLVIYLNL